MANREPGEALGEVLVDILKIVFSLIFPFLLITLCGVSFVLVSEFHMPEFGLWAHLAEFVIGRSTSNIWVAVGLGVFCLAALPLAWVAFREQELRGSSTILAYVIAAFVIAFLLWLRTVWPVERPWELWAYGLIMFAGWQATINALMGTLGIVAHMRRKRPRPIKPPRQEPHGASREQRRSRNEPETI